MNNPKIGGDQVHPFVLFSQQYVFKPLQISGPRFCYASSIVLVEDGYGFLELDGTVYDMTRGTLVYIPSGTSHRWKSSEQQPMVHRCVYFDWERMARPDFAYENDYFCFDKRFAKWDYLGSEPLPSLTRYQMVNDVELWIKLFENFTFEQFSPFNRNQYNFHPKHSHELLAEISNDRKLQLALEKQGQFQLFLQHFLKCFYLHEKQPDPRIRKVRNWMDQCVQTGSINLAWETQIGDVAERCGLSRGYFHALFKEETGLSPKAYWNQKILKAAEQDLKYTALSITDIANKYSFSSVHYFSRKFHQHIGMSPKAYRNRSRIY